MSKIEKYLNERGPSQKIRYSADELDDMGKDLSKLVSKTSKELKYDIDKTYAFVLRLLTDVNAHSVSSDVERIFLKDLNR